MTSHMIVTLRRLAIIIAYMVPAYLALTTGLTMVINPPRGDTVMTADQQVAFDRQVLLDNERAFDAGVTSFNAWHHCASVADWKRQYPGQYPARMVQHMDHSRVLTIVTWAYPAAHGEWVVGFCS